MKTLEKSIRKSRGNVTPADFRDVMNNVEVPVIISKRRSFDPKNFTGQYNVFIKWSGILANFPSSWLAETCYPRPYLRVSTPQMLNDGLFGVSVMSQLKRKFSRQCFAQTDEFGVHFLMTSQYTHLISRRFLLASDNAMDVSLLLKSISCKIPDNLIKQL